MTVLLEIIDNKINFYYHFFEQWNLAGRILFAKLVLTPSSSQYLRQYSTKVSMIVLFKWKDKAKGVERTVNKSETKIRVTKSILADIWACKKTDIYINNIRKKV